MKKSILCIVSILLMNTIWAQVPGDTIVVQSWNYGSGNRDTVVPFPNLPSVSFEKVLLLYNMRCKNGLVSTGSNTNLGCGEWDYSCNTFIHDSTRADSVSASVNSHRISGFSGSSFPYSTTSFYNYYREILQNTSYTIVNQTSYPLAANNASLAEAIPVANYNGKSQYLFTASELSGTGLAAGNISGIKLFSNNNFNAQFFRIRIKHSSLTALNASTPTDTAWQVVFFNHQNFTNVAAGNQIIFSNPFNWNGSSNILIEFSFTNNNGLAGNPTLKGNTSTFVSGISTSGDKHFYLNGTNYATITNYNGIGGASDRTVEAWIRTNVSNKEIVTWGNNTNSEKWTVRINGNGELRCEVSGGNIIGTTILTDSQWHHIAVSFSGNNINQAKLYVDGNLENISSSTAYAVNTNVATQNVRIGYGHNNTYFNGNIDAVRIWSTALSQNTIQNWMHKKMDATHPNYSNLEMDINTDTLNGSGLLVDLSGNNRNATPSATINWTNIPGKESFKDYVEYQRRPDINFLQGTYVLTNTSDTNWYTTQQIPYMMDSAIIVPNPGTILNDQINYSPQTPLWLSTTGNVYFDENHNYLNSTPGTTQGTINIVPLPYWQRSPMAFELMSFVTPYGINLNLGPNGKTWTFDITDLTPILKGNKRISMEFGGQWQEDMDLKFLFIVGTPPRNVLDISNIWKARMSNAFANIQNEKYFQPLDIKLNANASAFKVRTSITGHGQQGEFIPQTHYFDIDGGADEFSWLAWKKCGDNPVFPQGGTWIYDRAGWCPGMATDLNEMDITPYVTPGQIHNLDYGISSSPTGDSRYIVSNQLVSYGAINKNLDASVKDILHPSDRIEFAKENPTCTRPIIVIQNTGSTVLSSAQVDYWINAGNHKTTLNWTGNLKFLETDTLTLDIASNFWEDMNGPNGNIFYAEVSKANGSADDYVYNNKMQSPFSVTNVVPQEFVIMYKANSFPFETKINLYNAWDSLIFTKQATVPNALSYDTMRLANGCYSLQIVDTDEDGISFWANSDGSGYVRLRNILGGTIINLQGDFGSRLVYNFTVNYPLSYDELFNTFNAKIYPNPSQDIMFIEAEDVEKAQISFYNLTGQKIDVPLHRQKNKVSLDTKNIANGMYLLQLRDGNKQLSSKVVIEH